MSEQSSTRLKIADGHSRFLITRQMKENDKGYIGYDTIWESFHKVVEYKTPKRP